jgi:FAD:protein FMN transferase
VSDLFIDAVEAAIRAAALTAGAVDPTVGEALVVAGYDRDFAVMASGPAARPPATLRAVRVPGWRTIDIDRARRRLRLRPGVRLDLGATAKALAADRAAHAAARAAGGAGVLVSLGGDLAVAGEPPRPGWTVRVADSHLASAGDPGRSVLIRAGGLATSSVTVRRWGPGRHHIIDPASGRPVASGWRTVSVAAASCVDANTASTAAIVLASAAPGWLHERGMPARLVDRDGAVRTIAGWPEEDACL